MTDKFVCDIATGRIGRIAATIGEGEFAPSYYVDFGHDQFDIVILKQAELLRVATVEIAA